MYENATSTEILAPTCENADDLQMLQAVCRCDLEEDKEASVAQDNAFAFAVSIFTVGGIVGSFSTGFLVTKFGRKNTQLINMFLSIAAAILYYLSYHFARLVLEINFK